MLTQARALDLLYAASHALRQPVEAETLAALVRWLQEPHRTPRRLRSGASLVKWTGPDYDDTRRAAVLVLNAAQGALP